MKKKNNCPHFDNESIRHLREKRVKLILQVWDYMICNNIINKKRFKLSDPLVNEIVEHYFDDYRAVKCRYKIKGEIQLHKIAGLITSLIIRYRPIIPLFDEYQAKNEMYANEIFAIIHGLSICGEFSLNECEKISSEQWFDEWLNDFIYLLHNRNHTPESLIFIYQTFCIHNFPNNFVSDPNELPH